MKRAKILRLHGIEAKVLPNGITLAIEPNGEITNISKMTDKQFKHWLGY